MRQFMTARTIREAAVFLAYLAIWTVLASSLMLAMANGPLRLTQFHGAASAWAWWSYLLAGAPHPLRLSSIMGPGPSVWSLMPAMLLISSGSLAALILGAANWHLSALYRWFTR